MKKRKWWKERWSYRIECIFDLEAWLMISKSKSDQIGRDYDQSFIMKEISKKWRDAKVLDDEVQKMIDDFEESIEKYKLYKKKGKD
jgi:hypothetical protein